MNTQNARAGEHRGQPKPGQSPTCSNRHQGCTLFERLRRNARAALRHLVVSLLLLLTVLAVAGASLLPGRIRRCRPALWLVVGYVRLALAVYGVKIICPERAIIRHHEGLVFINHLSHLDAMAWLSLGPARSLAAVELRRYPLVGRLADAVGTVYVNRSDQASRRQARNAVAAAVRHEPYPALVIAPEGKLGPGDRLLPFRHGAFAIAVEQRIPVLLCTLHYTPLEVAIWHGGQGETMQQAFWRLGQLSEPMQVEINIVERLHPQPGDDPAALAEHAQQVMSRVLGLAVDGTGQVLETGPVSSQCVPFRDKSACSSLVTL